MTSEPHPIQSTGSLGISRLTLGTAQFGMPYGVANRVGQPSPGEVVQLIRAALDGGINCFDTAAAYGTSEQVLGDALRELRMSDQVSVVTKVPPLPGDIRSDPGQAEQWIENSVDSSRQRLRIDCLPAVLLHSEVDIDYLNCLLKLRDKGRICHVGVSCSHSSGVADRLISEGTVAAIQIPANVVDRRHEQSGILERAGHRQLAVFVRSVYLQGLLLMPEQEIPVSLGEIIPVRRHLQSVATEAGISCAELCVRYVLSLPGVTSLVVGVEALPQLQQNLLMVARGPLNAEIMDAIRSGIPHLPESVMTPFQWLPRHELIGSRSADNPESGRTKTTTGAAEDNPTENRSA
ncbi:MAG: aldo/keto reductase [Planctomycetaceae bacterium]|nr:aldo/keto reductase [Planctomycetaceae bacterium]